MLSRSFRALKIREFRLFGSVLKKVPLSRVAMLMIRLRLGSVLCPAARPAPLLCSNYCVHGGKHVPLLRSGGSNLCCQAGDKHDRRVRSEQRASALRSSTSAQQTYRTNSASARVQSASPSLLHSRSCGAGEGESFFPSPRTIAVIEATSQGGHPTPSEEAGAGPPQEQVEARGSRACRSGHRQ